MMIHRSLVTCSLLLIVISKLDAQVLTNPVYKPDQAEIAKRYASAKVLDSTIRGKVFKTLVQANWIPGRETFWYSTQLRDSVREYILTDARTGKKSPLFDHARLAAALAGKSVRPMGKDRLMLANLSVSPDLQTLRFQMDNHYWIAELPAYAVRDSGVVAASRRGGERFGFGRNQVTDFRRSRWQSFGRGGFSPDSNWNATISNGNIVLFSKDKKDSIQFTTDGTEEKPYGSLTWSPDSKTLVGYRITPYRDSLVYYISTSDSGTTRGQLRSQQYKQPGDPFTTYSMSVFSVAKRKTVATDILTIDFFSAPYLAWRQPDPRYFLFEKVDRGHQRFRIMEVDVETGKMRTVVDEQTNTFIYEQRILTEYLPESNEVIWATEKDGWRHLYMVNTLTGVSHLITKGNWVVRDIDSIDHKKKQIWFRASGMDSTEDPYHVHYYRIGFDGKNLLSLTPGKGNHTITWSPDRKYFLDTYSQINVPPVIELRGSKDGKIISVVEKADVEMYTQAGFRFAEPFKAKGRDGVTDIWGVVFRPTNFDSTKSYPVIENIYAGPQDAFVPKNFIYGGEMQSIAELGFIVVQIDGMGTANRSKAFHDLCWKNLADAGFEDRILWIKALAAKYPYVNAGRVGLYGTSAGGQNSLGGLLFHPEFYKAAVSACGCHDNRVDKQWWNEQWMGYPIGKHYEEQSNVTNASKLQGDLLLIVGEADTNVPPESTYRVADALIKSGKEFSFLAVPGMGHSDGGVYGRNKKKDFFVKSLLGVDPPRRNGEVLK